MTDPLEGKTGTSKSTGERVVRKGGEWVPLETGKPLAQEASQRGRMDLGLAPMVAGQEGMSRVEKEGNPYDWGSRKDNVVAKIASDTGFEIPGLGIDFHPLDGIAKHIGGQDFQDYQQAAKSFEAQLMPIMSGAAVSPSEASRQIKAALPELGDTPQTLEAKSRTRKMMLNGAAKSRHMPLPYPDVPTWGVNTLKLDSQQPAPKDDPLGIRRR